jgi:hypothetical protein
VVTGLSVAAGRFDLTDNALVVDYTGASPAPQIADLLRRGYNAGAWTGSGIISSMANAAFGVGMVEASTLDAVPPIFGTVDSDAVLARLARFGDATLDGVVNLADFNRLAANFGASGKIWGQGDFNYDGVVNLIDFNLLASNFGLAAGTQGPTPEDWAALASTVPEPSAGAVVALAVIGGLLPRAGRTRRRR